jgi:hypothetical protein
MENVQKHNVYIKVNIVLTKLHKKMRLKSNLFHKFIVEPNIKFLRNSLNNFRDESSG